MQTLVSPSISSFALSGAVADTFQAQATSSLGYQSPGRLLLHSLTPLLEDSQIYMVADGSISEATSYLSLASLSAQLHQTSGL
jgi:hypothetical protein